MKPYRPKDSNQLAKHIVDLATGDATETYEKDPKAVKRGKKGGKIGGIRRAESLTSERRSEIALAAAQARWQD